MSRPKAVERIVTSPYPSFPTDLQSQVMVLLSLADGFSVMKETVFEGRFKHVEELSRMGADISTDRTTRLYAVFREFMELRWRQPIFGLGRRSSLPVWPRRERPWWSKFTILIAVMIVLKTCSKV